MYADFMSLALSLSGDKKDSRQDAQRDVDTSQYDWEEVRHRIDFRVKLHIDRDATKKPSTHVSTNILAKEFKSLLEKEQSLFDESGTWTYLLFDKKTREGILKWVKLFELVDSRSQDMKCSYDLISKRQTSKNNWANKAILALNYKPKIVNSKSNHHVELFGPLVLEVLMRMNFLRQYKPKNSFEDNFAARQFAECRKVLTAYADLAENPNPHTVAVVERLLKEKAYFVNDRVATHAWKVIAAVAAITVFATALTSLVLFPPTAPVIALLLILVATVAPIQIGSSILFAKDIDCAPDCFMPNAPGQKPIATLFRLKMEKNGAGQYEDIKGTAPIDMTLAQSTLNKAKNKSKI